jgi:amino acid permease
MLPLAFGLAQGGPSGVAPALFLALFFGTLSASTMVKYAKLALTHDANSIGELWSKLIDPSTRWVAEGSL